MVGFILTNVSSRRTSVRPPKIVTTMAVMTAMRGSLRVSHQLAASAARMVGTKTAVAKRICSSWLSAVGMPSGTGARR